MTRLLADQITLSYGGASDVLAGFSLNIPDGKVTSIIGPNGCGKSTLLRALARMMAPRDGAVILDGEQIHQLSTKEVARRLCLLSQQPTAPEAMTVEDLAYRGRYPHQSLLQAPSGKDHAAVERALELAGMTTLRHRPVDELSGGQRQRAWIAMALAQETDLLLFDEPTTYLDIAHQQEVLALVHRLNREEGRTVVMVLHDINNAAMVSDHIVALRDGKIVSEGAPEDVLNPVLLEQVFDVSCDVVTCRRANMPFSVPRSRITFGKAEYPCDFSRCTLCTNHLCAGYARRAVLDDVSLDIPTGRISAIVGPNACGKSTLLRTIGRLLNPTDGGVTLDGLPVRDVSHREFSRRLAVLSQGSVAPDGVLVHDLVAVGRYPYQRWYRQWSKDDERAVQRAMEATGVADLRWRPVETLSGGQRQRVWLAMALAQETDVLLLDEPTTFLDIAHQVEVLDLVLELNRNEGRTVVMVLHDLGQACRYADYLVAMKAGRVVASGAPSEIMTPRLVRDVFEVESSIVPDPLSGRPLVLPGFAV